MALFSGFNVTTSDVEDLAAASLAAFAGGAIPDGWNVVTPASLGVSSAYWDGIYFTNEGASAIVLQQGSEYIVAFRGTDGSDDVAHFPGLFFGGYIDLFDPLLSALASTAPSGSSFAFTGASLGGGATNLMAEIAPTAYGGLYANAQFVAFASPNITDASGILNIGAENDPIYKSIELYADFSSSLDHLVLATPEYMAGNYDGLHPPDVYAHEAADVALDALTRVENSVFYDLMSPDSVVIIDASPGYVQDITPGRESVGAFYLGESVADEIDGNSGNDHIEGFEGNDVLIGGAGNDAIAGGLGSDVLDGDTGSDTLIGGQDSDKLLYGDAGTDRLFGGSGNDVLSGGADNDLLVGGDGSEYFSFDAGFGVDVVADFTKGADQIDFTDLDIDMSDITLVTHGNGIAVVTPEGIVQVQHVSSLHASDFVF